MRLLDCKLIALHFRGDVSHPRLSEEQIAWFADVGFDAVTLPAMVKEIAPEPGQIDVRGVVEEARACLRAGLLPLVWGPSWPPAGWMISPEYAFRRWDGGQHWGHMRWNTNPYQVVANVHHPKIERAIIDSLAAIHEQVPEAPLIAGYGPIGELKGPLCPTDDGPEAGETLWIHDPPSLDLFEKWYGTRNAPRTFEEGDWRGADFLSRRMTHFVEKVITETGYTQAVSMLILQEDLYSPNITASGFSTICQRYEEVRRRLAERGVWLGVFFNCSYICGPSRRLVYATTRNLYGWDAWTGGERLCIPKTVHMAKIDGYRGLISTEGTSRAIDHHIIRSFYRQVKETL